jgi:hypothetical protein
VLVDKANELSLQGGGGTVELTEATDVFLATILTSCPSLTRLHVVDGSLTEHARRRTWSAFRRQAQSWDLEALELGLCADEDPQNGVLPTILSALPSLPRLHLHLHHARFQSSGTISLQALESVPSLRVLSLPEFDTSFLPSLSIPRQITTLFIEFATPPTYSEFCRLIEPARQTLESISTGYLTFSDGSVPPPSPYELPALNHLCIPDLGSPFFRLDLFRLPSIATLSLENLAAESLLPLVAFVKAYPSLRTLRVSDKVLRVNDWYLEPSDVRAQIEEIRSICEARGAEVRLSEVAVETRMPYGYGGGCYSSD